MAFDSPNTPVKKKPVIDLPGAEPEVSSAERAAKRAAELRDRGILDNDGTDKYYIDLAIIPDGWSYEWKMNAVMGAEQPAYQVQLAQAGWDPVPATRHPEMMPIGWNGNTIDRNGMRLYERPAVITNESIARTAAETNRQVRDKEHQLSGAPIGTFERSNKGERLATIKKTYEHIPIPKE